MPLSDLHTTGWKYGSYEADRDNMIMQRENSPLYNSRNNSKPSNLDAHHDGNKSIAMGYGYDLMQNVNNLRSELKGYVSSKQSGVSTEAALQRVQELVKSNSVVGSNGVRYFSPTSDFPNIGSLTAEINKTITFGSAENAYKMLHETIAPKYENTLSNRLATKDIALANSQERLALVSMAYNSPGLIGDNLMNAIKNDNRAEAWFEIRYNTNGGVSRASVGHGIANRRVEESNTFGLHGASGVTQESAQAALQMHNAHLGKIGKEESSREGNGIYKAYQGNNSINSQLESSRNYNPNNSSNTQSSNNTQNQGNVAVDFQQRYISEFTKIHNNFINQFSFVDFSQIQGSILSNIMQSYLNEVEKINQEILGQLNSNINQNQQNATTEDKIIYTVKRGDTLTAIAREFNVNIQDITALNPGLAARQDHIKIGEKFNIPVNDKNSNLASNLSDTSTNQSSSSSSSQINTIQNSGDIRDTISANMASVTASYFGKDENGNRRFEYGRHDVEYDNRYGNKRTDKSRFEEDIDKDGLKGVDCSSLVWKGLELGGYNITLLDERKDFSTHDLFQSRAGNKFTVTSKAKEYFDSVGKQDLKPGDILMFRTNSEGAQHVGFFTGYDKNGNIQFFGSQVSTGPATVTFKEGSKDYWDVKFLGALRPNLNLVKPEVLEEFKANMQENANDNISSEQLNSLENLIMSEINLLGKTFNQIVTDASKELISNTNENRDNNTNLNLNTM